MQDGKTASEGSSIVLLIMLLQLGSTGHRIASVAVSPLLFRIEGALLEYGVGH